MIYSYKGSLTELYLAVSTRIR